MNKFEQCDKFCSHTTHPFIYKLSKQEKDYIIKTGFDNIYNDNEYDFTKETQLENLKNSLSLFFESNKDNEYFFRLNKLSPKDAYYIMNDEQCSENESELECSKKETDEPMTVETIKRDIEYLHVGTKINNTVEHCIKLLLHSERIYFELSFDDQDNPADIYVLLLNYNKINYKTETRCYINEDKLVAVSQYYTDLTNTYDDPEKIIQLIKEKIKNICTSTCLKSFVCDVYFDYGEIHLIEFNPYNHATDPCLFNWTEIKSEQCTFRYKKDSDICSVLFK